MLTIGVYFTRIQTHRNNTIIKYNAGNEVVSRISTAWKGCYTRESMGTHTYKRYFDETWWGNSTVAKLPQKISEQKFYFRHDDFFGKKIWEIY